MTSETLVARAARRQDRDHTPEFAQYPVRFTARISGNLSASFRIASMAMVSSLQGICGLWADL